MGYVFGYTNILWFHGKIFFVHGKRNEFIIVIVEAKFREIVQLCSIIFCNNKNFDREIRIEKQQHTGSSITPI